MTVRTATEFRQAIAGLRDLEVALEAIRARVGGDSPNFSIIAQGTLDEIARLRAEIDDYKSSRPGATEPSTR